MCRHKGFTLIELMVVLLIMGMLLSLAWPRLDRIYQHYALNSSATQLAWTLREARSEAMFKGQPSSIRFYVSLNRYRSDTQAYYLLKGIQYVGEPNFTYRIGSIPACSFNGTGAPAGGGTVVLKNRFNERKYIIVNPVLGKVRVSDKPPENW